MTGSACVVFDPTLCDYKFSDDHPLNPIRVDLTMRLAGELGITGGGALPGAAAPTGEDEPGAPYRWRLLPWVATSWSRRYTPATSSSRYGRPAGTRTGSTSRVAWAPM